MEQELGVSIRMDEVPLDAPASVTKFIQGVQSSKPDALLLIPFKEGHWEHVVRIVEETRIPTVILVTQGILLMRDVRPFHRKPGVFLINSLDNLEAVARGLRMVRTARWMRESRIANITGTELLESTVPVIGTRVRTIPHERFYTAFQEAAATDEVRHLARTYLETAKDRVEPTEADVLEAAKTYFVFKRLLSEERADAVMMNCLPGLKRPHKHVPPCMGFMSLRDEGIPMGCESDLDATLTMMLLQQLFDRPAFQHNPSADTETNHYFCAHCTSASKMNGVSGPSEPYVLRSHAEAGWGCVPRVLMREGQEVTIAKYLSAESGGKPQMIVYTGTILGCPPIPPTGGCRTNVEATLNELQDVCDVKGHHLCLVYGNYARELRDFCQLYDIEVVV
jgi:L-fucose isomerase-like protein